MHWSITDQPPNSDRIWAQWKTVAQPSFNAKNRHRECDESPPSSPFSSSVPASKASASFGPIPITQSPSGPFSRKQRGHRVVVPTSQIFLAEDDTF